MKFEISAFTGLLHRFSFTSGRRMIQRVGDKFWWSAPPLFAGQPELYEGTPLPHSERIANYQTVFFTINREEKIRNPEFLESVTSILHRLPNTCFVWTGKTALPEITNWFQDHCLHDRCFYVGWIDPNALLARGHIFLDTPSLSGSVAAKSMACGVPVMTFHGAHSWVNFFKPVLDEELPTIDYNHPLAPVRRLLEAGLLLECTSVEEYVRQAVVLATNADQRQLYAEGMRAFAQHYFMKNHVYARMHFDNFSVTRADYIDQDANA